jgi:hypothetical protein
MKPLFRVFWYSGHGWLVCGINLEGEPISTEGKYRSLKQALAHAARANEVFAGIKPVVKRRTR